jgi:hypothetical protein
LTLLIKETNKTIFYLSSILTPIHQSLHTFVLSMLFNQMIKVTPTSVAVVKVVGGVQRFVFRVTSVLLNISMILPQSNVVLCRNTLLIGVGTGVLTPSTYPSPIDRTSSAPEHSGIATFWLPDDNSHVTSSLLHLHSSASQIP